MHVPVLLVTERFPNQMDRGCGTEVTDQERVFKPPLHLLHFSGPEALREGHGLWRPWGAHPSLAF